MKPPVVESTGSGRIPQVAKTHPRKDRNAWRWCGNWKYAGPWKWDRPLLNRRTAKNAEPSHFK